MFLPSWWSTRWSWSRRRLSSARRRQGRRASPPAGRRTPGERRSARATGARGVRAVGCAVAVGEFVYGSSFFSFPNYQGRNRRNRVFPPQSIWRKVIASPVPRGPVQASGPGGVRSRKMQGETPHRGRKRARRLRNFPKDEQNEGVGYFDDGWRPIRSGFSPAVFRSPSGCRPSCYMIVHLT